MIRMQGVREVKLVKCQPIALSEEKKDEKRYHR